MYNPGAPSSKPWTNVLHVYPAPCVGGAENWNWLWCQAAEVESWLCQCPTRIKLYKLLEYFFICKMEVIIPHGFVRLNRIVPVKVLRPVPVSCHYLLIPFIDLETNNKFALNCLSSGHCFSVFGLWTSSVLWNHFNRHNTFRKVSIDLPNSNVWASCTNKQFLNISQVSKNSTEFWHSTQSQQ